jgi:hypothetical protein
MQTILGSFILIIIKVDKKNSLKKVFLKENAETNSYFCWGGLRLQSYIRFSFSRS